MADQTYNNFQPWVKSSDKCLKDFTEHFICFEWDRDISIHTLIGYSNAEYVQAKYPNANWKVEQFVKHTKLSPVISCHCNYFRLLIHKSETDLLAELDEQLDYNNILDEKSYDELRNYTFLENWNEWGLNSAVKLLEKDKSEFWNDICMDQLDSKFLDIVYDEWATYNMEVNNYIIDVAIDKFLQSQAEDPYPDSQDLGLDYEPEIDMP